MTPTKYVTRVRQLRMSAGPHNTLVVSVVTVRLTVKLPWWSRVYVEALKFSQFCGVLIADAEVAAEFIGKHARVSMVVE